MSPIQTTRISNYRWVVCFMLLMATTINYMDRQVLSLTWKDFIAPEFAWTDEDYGFITGAFALVYAIFLLIAGPLIDIIGNRRGYLWAMGIWTVGAVMHAFCGIATSGMLVGEWLVTFDGAKEALHNYGVTGLAITTLSIYLFMACRFVLAFGQSGNFPAAIKTTAEYFPKKDRAFATAIFNNGASIGALFAPLTIPIIARSFGWETAFLTVGSTGFLWMFLWIIIYEKPKESEHVNISELAYINQNDDNDTTAYDEKRIPFIKCLKYRQTWAFVIGKFMTDSVWWFILFWVPVYISDTYSYTSDSPMGMALIFVIYLLSLTSLAGGYLPTYLIDKMGMTPYRSRLLSLCICACIEIIGFTAIPLGQVSPWLFVLILGIQGAAHQSWSANLFSLVGDFFPKNSIATVIGIGGFAGGLASYLVMISTGLLLSSLDTFNNGFSFIGFDGKQGIYMLLFCGFSLSYIIGWAMIKFLISTNEPVDA